MDSTRHTWASPDNTSHDVSSNDTHDSGVVEWGDAEQRECIRDCFVTGDWGGDDEDEDMGDFEVRLWEITPYCPLGSFAIFVL